MNIKLIASQVVLVVVLALTTWATWPSDVQKKTELEKETPLSALSLDRLVAITLDGKNKDGERVSVKLTRPDAKSKEWVVASSYDYKVKNGLVDKYLAALRKIQQGEWQTADLELVDKFGLGEDDRTTITFFGEEDSELGSLVFGETKQGSVEGSTFTYILVGDEIRRCPTDLHDLKLDDAADLIDFDASGPTDPNYWLDRTILKLEEDKIIQVVLVSADGKVTELQRIDAETLARIEGGKVEEKDKKKRLWRRLERDARGNMKAVHKVKESTVDSVVWNLSNIKAKAVVKPMTTRSGESQPADSEFKRLGMDPRPALQVLIVHEVAGQVEPAQTVLSFGKRSEKGKDKPSVYCSKPGESFVKEVGKGGGFGRKGGQLLKQIPSFEVEEYILDGLSKKPEEFEPEEKKDPEDPKKDGPKDPEDPKKDGPKDPKDPKKDGPKDPKKDGPKDPKKDGDPKESEEVAKFRLLVIGWKGAEGSAATRTKAEAKKLADELYAKLTAKEKPASFADTAREQSDDESKKDGGDLGYIGKGVRSPAFTKVAFALKKGETSAVVELPSGYAVIRRVD